MMDNKKIKPGMQLSDCDLEKANGGFSPYGGIVCDKCGGIKDNPNIPDWQKCHCDEGVYYNSHMGNV